MGTLEAEVNESALRTSFGGAIEQVQVVRDAGCNLGQGFYFSRAVPHYLAAMLLAQEREELYRKAIG